jgi:uncharacterized protein (DUF2141 family)
MKSKAASRLQKLVLLAILGLSARVAADGAGARLTVRVKTFRNTQGALACRLFRSGEGFPEAPDHSIGMVSRIVGESAECVFEGVKPGTYAVSVMHDENGNQQLDKNFLGIPKEGYGVSNNHTHALGAPNWDESKFEVAEKDLQLDIALRY